MELSIGKRFTVDLTTEEVGLVMELIDGFDDPEDAVIHRPNYNSMQGVAKGTNFSIAATDASKTEIK